MGKGIKNDSVKRIGTIVSHLFSEQAKKERSGMPHCSSSCVIWSPELYCQTVGPMVGAFRQRL